jgi:hypothetical protein
MLVSEEGFTALLFFVGDVGRVSLSKKTFMFFFREAVATAPTQPNRRMTHGTKSTG